MPPDDHRFYKELLHTYVHRKKRKYPWYKREVEPVDDTDHFAEATAGIPLAEPTSPPIPDAAVIVASDRTAEEDDQAALLRRLEADFAAVCWKARPKYRGPTLRTPWYKRIVLWLRL